MGKHRKKDKKRKTKRNRSRSRDRRERSSSSSSSFYSSSHLSLNYSSSSSSTIKNIKKDKRTSIEPIFEDHKVDEMNNYENVKDAEINQNIENNVNNDTQAIALTQGKKKDYHINELEIRNRLLNNLDPNPQAMEVYSFFKRVNYMEIPNIYSKL